MFLTTLEAVIMGCNKLWTIISYSLYYENMKLQSNTKKTTHSYGDCESRSIGLLSEFIYIVYTRLKQTFQASYLEGSRIVSILMGSL